LPITTNKRVRFGIIGFGLHATKRLMPGFAQAERCTITALTRRNLEQAQRSAREYSINHSYASVEELCADQDVDAVFVASPNACHLDHTVAALIEGKPVLVEKPMALNADQCRRMIDTAHQARLPLGVAQIFRFHASVNRIRQLLADGAIGKLTFARCEFSFFGRGHRRTWLNDPAIAGGGPIFDVGVHCVDALRYILRDEVTEVSTITHSDEESRQVEAAAMLTLRFASGTIATVAVGYRAEYRTPIEFVGEAGVLGADNALTVEHPVAIELLRRGKVVAREEVSNAASYAHQVDALAAAVLGERAFPIPGEEGWRNQVIIDAAYRSGRIGSVERVHF
jgi:predicted dehydrogenase